VAAATLYALLGTTPERAGLAGCLSTILATAVVLGIAIWVNGVTSTLAIGFVFTFGIAACVSFTVVASLYGIDEIRSE
jgi:hypothetical protein